MTADLKRRSIQQFGHPRGIAGRLVGWVMAHRGSNRKRNIWAVSLLDVRPADRVLEVGFGPGVAIAEFARRVTLGNVYGIDRSAVMVRQASRRNRVAIRTGRVVLTQASVDQLPDFGEPLDLVFSVNSLGFWTDPVARLQELRRLLRPGGRIALVSQPRFPGVTTAQAAQELEDRLTQAGFTQLRLETLALEPPVACVQGVNSA